jgi:hypothetical protein
VIGTRRTRGFDSRRSQEGVGADPWQDFQKQRLQGPHRELLLYPWKIGYQSSGAGALEGKRDGSEVPGRGRNFDKEEGRALHFAGEERKLNHFPSYLFLKFSEI